jgi:DNA polymerase elongation subunit (family B)
MGVCGHYCVQDSNLVMDLFVKTQQWIGLCEMAKTCNVPMTVLYTQGQQIKVYSQVFKYNYKNNIITQKDGYISNKDDHYIGATVFPPKPGVYNRVLPFDFKSLYPTIIIAYNIDYSTLVPDDSDIPDEDCNIIEWKEHIGCEHDPDTIRRKELDMIIDNKKDILKDLRKTRDKCKDNKKKENIKKEIETLMKKMKPFMEERSNIVKKKHKFILCNDNRRFRFLKEPKGVLPTVLHSLLEARKNTRVQIKQLKSFLKNGEIHDNIRSLLLNGSDKKMVDTLITVLDKRQLSYKVSCNSMYGAMGVSRGYLPFMPGAMCTTAKGRQNIGIVADVIQNKFKGQLVYGDTDSNYIRFPHLKTAKENWDYAVYVAKQVSDIFPDPIELEFEEEIYWRFAILTKKRYMYQKCKRDGKVDEKIGNKGVLLSRRDNSKLVRNLYENIMMKIFKQLSIHDVYYYIISEINKLCSGMLESNVFVITKKVGNHEKKINKSGQDVNVYLECSKCEGIILCDNKKYNNSCKCTIQERDKGIMGEYRVPLIDMNDEKSIIKQFKLKNCSNIEDYYTRCLPAQVQLAERMRKERGQRVEQGSRIEYVITLNGNHNGKQYEKIEHIDYFNRHKYEKKIDYLYYLNMISNPIDQLLNIMYVNDKYFVKDFVGKQYKLRSKIREKYLNDIKKLTTPNIEFE